MKCGPDGAEGDSVTGSQRRARPEKNRTVVPKLGSCAAVEGVWASESSVRAEDVAPITVTDAPIVGGGESGAYIFHPSATRARNVTRPRPPCARVSP